MRLIDADEMIKRLQEWNTNDGMDKALYNFTMHRILEQPTIEPKRQKGKWIRHKDGSATCNQCGFKQTAIWDLDGWQNYCGHCGCDMRGNTDG